MSLKNFKQVMYYGVSRVLQFPSTSAPALLSREKLGRDFAFYWITSGFKSVRLYVSKHSGIGISSPVACMVGQLGMKVSTLKLSGEVSLVPKLEVIISPISPV
jgi:hypothetical protein